MKTIITKKYTQSSYGIQSYPFAKMEQHYRYNLERFGPETLLFALKDAVEAQKAQDSIEQAGGTGTDKDSGWRADDVHTICKIMMENGIEIPKRV